MTYPPANRQRSATPSSGGGSVAVAGASEAGGRAVRPPPTGAIREARGSLELLGKLAGQLQEGPTVNILVSAEWRGLQTVILKALEPHAAARLAVAEALATVEYAGTA